MTKEIIRTAAITARMLGYKVVRDMPNSEGYQNVVVHNLQVMPNNYPWLIVSFSGSHWELPTDTEILGHFLVRLHMEKHYGITTPHYWEKDYGK